tara:strand:- start:23718 stop:25676 length:1959 start_codon:yes stop_codon:yes gene_type:complete
MGEKYAFSSMLHLVWAVVLVLGMGFVHFYMSMIATSFDPCPENQADANLKASIDKSTKYFNDIKMIHLGIAGAIILTMLIGKAIVPRDGKTVCSIVTIVLKLAACLIVVFGVSHAQNILKLRNKQCNNSIDEVKMRELKILIEACIGSIGVIIGNYLSLGINNLISFNMPSSMSIIITTVVCILLVFSIIGGDALINIFKKELNIKNECVALNEELSKVDVSIGPANNILGGILPDRLQLSGDKTYKDLNAGKTVITGKPIITTESESYEPGSEQTIKIAFQQEQKLKNNAIKIIFPSGFKYPSTESGLVTTIGGIEPIPTLSVTTEQKDNSITFKFPKDEDYTLKKDDDYFTLGITKVILPNTLGFTEPIKLEILSVPDDNIDDATVEQVSYNNYFDLKDDTFVTFDSLNITKVTTMSVRMKVTKPFSDKLKKDGGGLVITLPEGKDSLWFPELKELQPIQISGDNGHSSDSSGKVTKGQEFSNYEVQSVGVSGTVINRFDNSTPNAFKQFKIIKKNIDGGDIPENIFIKFTVPILTTQKPVKFASLTLKHDAPELGGTPEVPVSGSDLLTHNHPIEFIDPAVQKDTKCPVLSRDLFMKIFLTSVMTGWAVSSIIYLSGDLYEYNSSNMALLLAGAGGTGEVVVNVTKPEA